MRAALAGFMIAAGCGPSRAHTDAVHPVIVVPDPERVTATEVPGGLERLPPRGTPEPAPPPDPFDAYVGAWDGLVNQTVPTRLVVDRNGRFRVDADSTPYRIACDLEGRFRADSERIWMDVEKTSCGVITVGATLERRIVQRTEDSFTVESPDGTLLIRYTRRER